MDYSQASWWCRCSLFQHGILIFRTKLCFNIFNASGAVKCRYRCVFYKLVPDKNSMDAISGCQALHCATLSVSLFSTSDPREGGSCSGVGTGPGSGPACRDQGARRTSSGQWGASGCRGGGPPSRSDGIGATAAGPLCIPVRGVLLARMGRTTPSP